MAVRNGRMPTAPMRCCAGRRSPSESETHSVRGMVGRSPQRGMVGRSPQRGMSGRSRAAAIKPNRAVAASPEDLRSPVPRAGVHASQSIRSEGRVRLRRWRLRSAPPSSVPNPAHLARSRHVHRHDSAQSAACVDVLRPYPFVPVINKDAFHGRSAATVGDLRYPGSVRRARRQGGQGHVGRRWAPAWTHVARWSSPKATDSSSPRSGVRNLRGCRTWTTCCVCCWPSCT